MPAISLLASEAVSSTPDAQEIDSPIDPSSKENGRAWTVEEG
jgi:hypothetical protein